MSGFVLFVRFVATMPGERRAACAPKMPRFVPLVCFVANMPGERRLHGRGHRSRFMHQAAMLGMIRFP
jgi:hypothetical protein